MNTDHMMRIADGQPGNRRRADVPVNRSDSRVCRVGGRNGFSLIEIIIVVGLLSVIMLGLMLMFGQTQRVFQSSMTQVDVLEAGRAATGLLAHEIEQIAPSYTEGSVNFFAMIPSFAPLIQPLPGSGSILRTNVMEEVFFLTRENQTWTGIGYRVSNPADGIGTLYRYETNSNTRDPSQLFNAYNTTALTNMSPVMDGVMHFRIRAYDTNGVFITGNIGQEIRADVSSLAGGEIGLYAFTNNAVPGAVEIELGILENRAYDRAKSLRTAAARYSYLTNQVGRLQIFRQLIPIRNVDPSAYQ